MNWQENYSVYSYNIAMTCVKWNSMQLIAESINQFMVKQPEMSWVQ